MNDWPTNSRDGGDSSHEVGERPPGERGNQGDDAAKENDASDISLEECHRSERPRRRRHHRVRELHGADQPSRHHAHAQAAVQRRRVDEGVQDDVTDIGKDRQADDEATQREREGHPPLADPADHRRRDPLDAAGVLERLGQDRSKDDHDGDALNRAAEALLEGGDERPAVDAGDQREEQDRHEERNEDVPAEPRDQQEEERDDSDQPRDGGEYALGDNPAPLLSSRCT